MAKISITPNDNNKQHTTYKDIKPNKTSLKTSERFFVSVAIY